MFRLISQLARISLARRFVQSVREDGARVALAKVRSYTAMRLRGGSHSSLTPPETPTATEDSYLRGTWAQLAQEDAFHVSAPATLHRRRFVAIIGDLNLQQCKKYRVEQMAAFWQAQGYSADISHYQDLPRCVRLLSQATHLVEYRLQTMPVTEMLRYEAHRLRLPILYDLDDPLFSVSAYEGYGNMAALDGWMKQHFLSEAPKYLSMMNGADLLSMSTPGLVDHTRLYSHRPVYMRRNFADADTLAAGAAAIARRTEGDGQFRVAFASGSQGHEVDFAEIAEPLFAFLRAADNRRLSILGHFDLSHLPKDIAARCDTMPFADYTTYLDTLAAADCAVMPLADDVFNRCKSAVRVIDAHSVGLPTLVGPVSDMSQMVAHGETGFVAHTQADWADALQSLADDPAGARAMGATARQRLETRWHGHDAPHIIAPELLEWVRG